MNLLKIKTPQEVLEMIKGITISEERRSNCYVFGRDNKGYKVRRSKLVWEKHNGSISKGMMIHHKNGIKDDDRIENLEIVSRKEHGLKHRKKDRIRIYYPKGVKIIKSNN